MGASLSPADTSLEPLDLNGLIGQTFRNDPFTRMQQMDSLFNSFSSSGVSVLGGRSFSMGSPTLSISEAASEYQILIQVPPDHDLEISTNLEASLLTVSGTLTRNASNSSNSFASNFSSKS